MKAWWNKWFKKSGEEDGVEVLPQEKEESMESDKNKTEGWLTRWRAPKKQEQQLMALREGFGELVGLTRAIREHMERQAHTQQALVNMMEQLPDAVEGLKNVGRATEQQTETLALLKEQLLSSSRNEEHLAESMSQFNKTLTVMDDLSKSTSQTVASMVDRTRRSEETLQLIIERSERRVLYMTITLWGIILLAVGAILHFGFDLWSGSPSDEVSEIVPIEETVLDAPEVLDVIEGDVVDQGVEESSDVDEAIDEPEDDESLPDYDDMHEPIEDDIE